MAATSNPSNNKCKWWQTRLPGDYRRAPKGAHF